VLPYVLMLLCPLLHLFLHSGHGNHTGHERQDEIRSSAEDHSYHRDR
jgi:hypothetical protein